jgi:hypothetical protein
MGRTLLWALVGLFGLAAASGARAGCDLGATTDPATAAQAEAISAALPLAYVGSFQWDGSDELQRVAFSFSGCVVGGKVSLIGRGVYLESGTEITVVAEVVGPDITLFERDPEGGNGLFVTDGRHQGEIAVDLSRICAVWTMDDGSASGRLRLGVTLDDAELCFQPLNIS